MDREEGYYWLRSSEGWMIGQWIISDGDLPSRWELIGTDISFDDVFFTEINKQLIPPPTE